MNVTVFFYRIWRRVSETNKRWTFRQGKQQMQYTNFICFCYYLLLQLLSRSSEKYWR